VPTRFYHHIMLNGPKRDEQIENMIATVRNIARAGIPIFGYCEISVGIRSNLGSIGRVAVYESDA
jgi:D-mannonate dehydratase